MNPAEQITDLADAINTLGGGAGVLVGLYLAWTVYKQVREWKLGPTRRRSDNTREEIKILQRISSNMEKGNEFHQRLLDSAKDMHAETLERLSDIRLDLRDRTSGNTRHRS